jgi:hypothetical protein
MIRIMLMCLLVPIMVAGCAQKQVVTPPTVVKEKPDPNSFGSEFMPLSMVVSPDGVYVQDGDTVWYVRGSEAVKVRKVKQFTEPQKAGVMDKYRGAATENNRRALKEVRSDLDLLVSEMESGSNHAAK